MPLGLYISVPFCRSKCSYCNFASDVFAHANFERYIERVCADIKSAEETAKKMDGVFDRSVDSIYVGGGSPTILDVTHLKRLFAAVSQTFDVQKNAEITVECAPGTLTAEVVESLLQCGVNRVSLGVQSFVDQESRAVGRLHTRAVVLEEVARLRTAGIHNINVDLIAGLPHQTVESWRFSLSETIALGVPHVSVYMLEVDEDSRLGRELIAGGTRYHAHFVPDEDLTADFYEMACEQLDAAGVRQYEISNFAREGFESQHNLKYWTRQPYLGFGVDAHSMLSATANAEAVRFSTPDLLDAYVRGEELQNARISRQAALEECFFLGLRLMRGIDLKVITAEFGQPCVDAFSETIAELVEAGLLERSADSIRLTKRGKLLSNEVFARFISTNEAVSDYSA